MVERTQEDGFQKFQRGIRDLNQLITEFLTPKQELEVSLRFDYSILYNLLRMHDSKKSSSTHDIVGGSREAEDLVKLGDFLKEGTILVRPKSRSELVIERIGTWLCEGMGALEELLPQYGIEQSLEEFQESCGSGAGEMVYGIRAENQGLIYLREGETSLFLPNQPPRLIDVRLWHRSDLLRPTIFILRDKELCENINQIYGAVHAQYKERADRYTIALLRSKDN